LALLEKASMYIHLDPRADIVKVPLWFKKQPQLVLQVGLNMAVPIPDLHVDDEGLSCTLSFNRAPFFCLIPWPAVFALVGENGQAMVWAEDVPAEVAAQAQAQRAPEKPRTHLRSVGEGESARPAEASKPESAPAAEKKSAAKSTKAAKAAKPKAADAEKPRAKSAKAKAEPKTVAPKVGASKATAQKSSKAAAESKAPSKKAQPIAEPAAVLPAPAVQPRPEAARASTEGGKPKRELPPYLRVVK